MAAKFDEKSTVYTAAKCCNKKQTSFIAKSCIVLGEAT